ncbi:MAG: bifunctional phosphopantothenoylcysteine decarboxylase/phosphopantothenate--cysteine ligase CoaBC [Saprospiraceae bacterium]|nr:bifunctional phosphopantothenoylcysteine decarboxylase/phosphopantothenate--cysteine ligase CoaBC [Saprospiraceae bacterium]
MSLEGKKIILGVCGSIAAYKSLILLRYLTKAGADVKVILTQDAQKFVGKLSFASLSSYEVLTDLSSDDQWKNHIELGLWADLFIIAPATANTIAKCATGITDNLLQAVYLSARCPVMIAPAMDLDMWAHPITQGNVKKLQSIGVQIIPVGTGLLASGLNGEGRLAEPEIIYNYILDQFNKQSDLKNKRILITAGPTFEAIDPVRFIGNHSSGKMGLRLAEAACQRGAKVDLVLGPVNENHQQINGLSIYKVVSAQDMMNKVQELENLSDYFILAAAVSDFMPENVEQEKIKKATAVPIIKLKNTPDIAQWLGMHKKNHQKLVGFALETNHVKENAEAKLHKKNMDMIVINSPRDEGAAFGHDTNKIDILKKSGEYISFELKSKRELAHDILDEMLKLG